MLIKCLFIDHCDALICLANAYQLITVALISLSNAYPWITVSLIRSTNAYP